MAARASAIYLVVLVLVILFLVWGFWNRSSGFTFKTYPTPSQTFSGGKAPTGSTFDNSEYQTYPPSIDLQEDYYGCIAQECGGNTFDYPCLQRCHLKSYRRYMSTPDHADWVCYYKRHNEDEYYSCLANVYSDYKFP